MTQNVDTLHEAAASAGAQCVEIDPEPSIMAGDFHETRQGRASEIVPDWVEGLLAGARDQSP